MTVFSIAGRPVGGDNPAYVIAEIGINHDGDEALAVELIEAAAAAGADAAKLQIVDADEAYVVGSLSHQVFSGCALKQAALERLMAVAARCDIALFATPGDMKSLRQIIALDMPAIKISSGLLSHHPLIRASAATGKPLILSTGLAALADVQLAVDVARDVGAAGVAVLECTALYPSRPEQVNLRAMATMRAAFGLPIGYSDHCLGDLACVAAVAAGAKVIEKHFSLDRLRPGADHSISAEPAELAQMVRRIRDVEQMLGNGVKAPRPEELAVKETRWRFTVARRDLPAGTVVGEDSAALKRLAEKVPDGIGAPDWERVVGRTLIRSVKRDQPITFTDLAG